MGRERDRREAAEQVRLPFDLPDDAPIPFALTARARRAVAPASLPPLTVLPDADGPVPEEPGSAQTGTEQPDAGEVDGAQARFEDAVDDDLDDPHDTRPSRARALRRAGVSFDDIAVEVGVDPLVVRAWVDDVAPVHSARRRLRPVAAGGGDARAQRAVEQAGRRERDDAFARTRGDARAAARDRVRQDASFTSGLGLIAGIAETGPHAMVLTTRDLQVASAGLRWLAATVDLVPERVRVILRIAPQAAADRLVHDWAAALDLPRERFRTTRWRHAPDADTVEAMVRIADPRVAGAVAGWRDALLGSFGPDASDDLDLAF